MALFSRSKKTEESAIETAAKVAVSHARATDSNLSSVIVKPRITEKAVRLGEQNVYTFVVRRDATKRDVSAAIKALYNVTPVNVNIVNKTPRQYKSRAKNRVLTEKGMKKAYVYLKKGDTISLV
jgi:large subunit ribosomal protein L23